MRNDEELVKWFADALLETVRSNYRRVFGKTFSPGPKVESTDRWAFVHSGNALGRVYQHVGSPRADGDPGKPEFEFFLMRSDAQQAQLLREAVTLLQERGVLYVTEYHDVSTGPSALGDVPRLTLGYRYEPTNPLDAIVRGITDSDEPVVQGPL